jgi:hypothetical protein
MHPYRHAIALSSFGLLLFTPALFGQTWSPEQREVLAVVEESWEADLAEDATWVDRLTHPGLLSWGLGYPMPRDRAQTKRWNQYGDENSNALLHHLAPVGIATHGDAAVVHYYVSVAFEDREGDRETIHTRCTDVLVREGSAWKYLAWHCTDEPSDDEG